MGIGIDCEIFGDHVMTIKSLNGHWDVRKHMLRILVAECQNKLHYFTQLAFSAWLAIEAKLARRVYRKANTEVDTLASQKRDEVITTTQYQTFDRVLSKNDKISISRLFF